MEDTIHQSKTNNHHHISTDEGNHNKHEGHNVSDFWERFIICSLVFQSSVLEFEPEDKSIYSCDVCRCEPIASTN